MLNQTVDNINSINNKLHVNETKSSSRFSARFRVQFRRHALLWHAGIDHTSLCATECDAYNGLHLGYTAYIPHSAAN